jgi:hypothetical protein
MDTITIKQHEPARVTPNRDSELLERHRLAMQATLAAGFRRIAKKVAAQIARELDIR